jgi:predicted DCC family thiol-disulfide oxidoreductase YuxK
MKKAKNILFFDGVCNFCNYTVDYYVKHNNKRNIYYSSLQSEFAKVILPEELTKVEEFTTIYFYTNGKIYSQSSAILRSLYHLSFVHKLLLIFLIVPKFIRDFVYSVISKNRHKIFGKSSSCRIPNENEKELFLETKADFEKFSSN